MKRIFKGLCSLFFATTIAFPASAMATFVEEFDDVAEEQVIQSSEPDNYKLAFLTGDFGLHFSNMGSIDQSGTLVMFLSDPNGRIIKNAQVITTIIDQNGTQQMYRANPMKGGYLVNTTHLIEGPYRLEAEIVTNGWLLTDEFYFQKA